jgi:hypothetical protein
MTIVFLIPAIILFSLAGYLAYKGREGWGWFLFVGLLSLPAMSTISSGKPITIDFTHESQSAQSDIHP